jgi:hypothetical protein
MGMRLVSCPFFHQEQKHLGPKESQQVGFDLMIAALKKTLRQ